METQTFTSKGMRIHKFTNEGKAALILEVLMKNVDALEQIEDADEASEATISLICSVLDATEGFKTRLEVVDIVSSITGQSK